MTSLGDFPSRPLIEVGDAARRPGPVLPVGAVRPVVNASAPGERGRQRPTRALRGDANADARHLGAHPRDADAAHVRDGPPPGADQLYLRGLGIQEG